MTTARLTLPEILINTATFLPQGVTYSQRFAFEVISAFWDATLYISEEHTESIFSQGSQFRRSVQSQSSANQVNFGGAYRVNLQPIKSISEEHTESIFSQGSQFRRSMQSQSSANQVNFGGAYRVNLQPRKSISEEHTESIFSQSSQFRRSIQSQSSANQVNFGGAYRVNLQGGLVSQASQPASRILSSR
jgi:hypothetical protein